MLRNEKNLEISGKDEKKVRRPFVYRRPSARNRLSIQLRERSSLTNSQMQDGGYQLQRTEVLRFVCFGLVSATEGEREGAAHLNRTSDSMIESFMLPSKAVLYSIAQ